MTSRFLAQTTNKGLGTYMMGRTAGQQVGGGSEAFHLERGFLDACQRTSRELKGRFRAGPGV